MNVITNEFCNRYFKLITCYASHSLVILKEKEQLAGSRRRRYHTCSTVRTTKWKWNKKQFQNSFETVLLQFHFVVQTVLQSINSVR